MKIAVLSPSPVPFTIGGAEHLWWALVEHINLVTPHQAELIKVPSPERTFWEVIDSYRRFCGIDLSHFDLVITGKYPAWMISHPRHICYMLHPLRGLRDSLEARRLQGYQSSYAGILRLQELMSCNQGRREILDELFECLDRLRTDDSVCMDAWAFPGELAREIVCFLDSIGLASHAIDRYFAISQTVARRNGYFPSNRSVEVVYPPTNLKGLHCAGQHYLFTASRLDAPKRIDLLIQAMHKVKANIEFRIAGSGPDHDRLAQFAQGDSRIRFLGHIANRELVKQYADALAVPFAPIDEDYGLVTLEAMLSAKPVLTTTDSGGPNELIQHKKTGFSVAPDPGAIAERIDHLCNNRDVAAQLGCAARDSVADITWENAITRLLADDKTSRYRYQPRRNPKRITLAASFAVYPPRGGGQNRIYYLYKHLAEALPADIELVTLTSPGNPSFNDSIAPGLREIRIPISPGHHSQEAAIAAKIGVPVTDVVLPELYRHTPDYLRALAKSAASADTLIACHPYLLPALQEVSDKPIWYEAQDVEIELKAGIFPQNSTSLRLLETTRAVERKCCNSSELIMVCSDEDRAKLNHLYNVPDERMITVPNGVDLQSVTFSSMETRIANKRRLNLHNAYTVLFMGSGHPPNAKAVDEIFKIANQLPTIAFLILGSVNIYFTSRKTPRNVRFIGVVDDETKDVALGIADLAINPVVSGSGTNLKMLDYCAAGIPVLTTPAGGRGLPFRHNAEIFVAEIESFVDMIKEIQNMEIAKIDNMMQRCHDIVEQKFSWSAIAQRFVSEVRSRTLAT